MIASCTASRQKSVVNVLESRHANTLRFAPFQDSEERRDAPTHGNVGAVSSSTRSGRKMTQVRMTSWGVAKRRHVFGRVFKRWTVVFNSRWVYPDQSVPPGRYWRSRPVVFSLVPQTQYSYRLQDFPTTSLNQRALKRFVAEGDPPSGDSEIVQSHDQ